MCPYVAEIITLRFFSSGAHAYLVYNPVKK